LRKIGNRDTEVGGTLIFQQAIKVVSVVKSNANRSKAVKASQDSDFVIIDATEKVPIAFFILESDDAFPRKTEQDFVNAGGFPTVVAPRGFAGDVGSVELNMGPRIS